MSLMNNPSAVLRMVKTGLLGGMRAIPSRYLGVIAKFEKSIHPSEQYAWAGEAPRLRLLGDDGELVWDNISDTVFSVTNNVWAAGLRIKRTHLDDDSQGIIRQRIGELATVASGHIDRMIVAAIVANGTGYDAAALFADSHAARGQQTAAQDNNLAGSGTTTAQVQVDLWDAYEARLNFLAENGEPYGGAIVEKLAILHPPPLTRQVQEATKAGLISNTSNVLSQSVSAITFAEPRLTDQTDLITLDITDPNDLPLILQERDGMEVTSLMQGDDAFNSEVLKFKARWRGNSAPGKWQRAVRTVNA